MHHKTAGNPFFVNMFLRSLYQDRLIDLDAQRRAWTFDLPKIHALDITDNVIDLMVRRIRKLPGPWQAMLSLAASIGNRVDLKTLSLLCGLSNAGTSDTLAPAIEQGLLLSASRRGRARRRIGPPIASFFA